MAAQLAVRRKGDENCPHHPGQKVQFECEDCPGTLICSLCFTSTHKRHGVRELSKKFMDEKAEVVRKRMETIQRKHIPRVEELARYTDRCFEQNKNHHLDVIKKVRTREQEAIDQIKHAAELEIDKIEMTRNINDSSLDIQKEKLGILLRVLRLDYNECDEALKKGSDVVIYDNAGEKKEAETDVPSSYYWHRCSFSPSDIKLSDCIGRVNTNAPPPPPPASQNSTRLPPAPPAQRNRTLHVPPPPPPNRTQNSAPPPPPNRTQNSAPPPAPNPNRTRCPPPPPSRQ